MLYFKRTCIRYQMFLFFVLFLWKQASKELFDTIGKNVFLFFIFFFFGKCFNSFDGYRFELLLFYGRSLPIFGTF